MMMGFNCQVHSLESPGKRFPVSDCLDQVSLCTHLWRVILCVLVDVGGPSTLWAALVPGLQS